MWNYICMKVVHFCKNVFVNNFSEIWIIRFCYLIDHTAQFIVAMIQVLAVAASAALWVSMSW